LAKMFKKTAIISLITLLITLLFLTSGVFPAAMAGERTDIPWGDFRPGESQFTRMDLTGS